MRLVTAGAALWMLLAAPLSAYQGGISGYARPGGETCTDRCHGGGMQPSVQLAAPATVTGGQTVALELIVQRHGTRQIAGGLDVGATAGVLASAAGDVREEAGELTHISPRLISDVNRDGVRTAADAVAWMQLPRSNEARPCQIGDLNGDMLVDQLDGNVALTAPFADGELRWNFEWQAPATAGTYTIYATALSANCNGANSGDDAASVSVRIQVQ